jgi:hypothetical protein
MAWAWQLVSPELTAKVRRRLQQATPISYGKDRVRDRLYMSEQILISSHLHWLAGGVLTLQTPGSSSARVLLMVTPSEDAPPPSTTHRHRGFDVTTLDSAEQHDELGFDALPDMYPRHGARLTISIVQLPPPEPDDGCAAP